MHPKDVQDGKIEFTGDDITTNLPFDPRVKLSFDHHMSETERLDVEKYDNLIIDEKARSAARVVYNYFGGAEKFKTVSEELMVAVDKGDSADFTMEEICKRLGIKYLLSTTVNKETGKFERICLKDNKLKAFFEFYGDAEIENFYTDSPENDYPLIEKAQHAFIVKGDKITQVK